MRRALRALAPVPAIPEALLGPGWDALLGTQVHAAPCAAGLGAPPGAYFTAVFAWPEGGTLLAALERPLARALAARALGLASLPEGPITPAEEGALGALALRAVARVCAPAPPPRLRAVTDDLAEALATLPAETPPLRWTWALSAPPLAGELAVILVPREVAMIPLPLRPAVLSAGLSLGVIAGRSAWPAHELATLRVGELLALDGLSDAHGSLRGAVDLVLGTPDGPRFSATLTPHGARLERTATLPPTTMSEADDPTTAPMSRATLDAIPLEVSVEIARVQATVAEVSAWRAGEVVTFAHPVGATVLVRAGGRAVARGELVDVEGCVGVRLTELL